jgi:hypothetical protein
LSYISYPKCSGTRRSFIAIVFNSHLVYTIRKLQENQVELKLNGTHQLLLYADDILVNLLEDTINAIKKNAQAVTDGINVVGLEIKREKIKYMLMSHHQTHTR